MDLSDILSLEAVIPALKANSKKQVLAEIAARAADVTGMPEREIFDTLMQRERLGSTGIGHGIAIPHGKHAAMKRLMGVFARLDRPIDFEAIDDLPVDLIFVLLAPEGAGADHLKALARVARLLRDPANAAKLRATDDPAALYSVLIQTMASNAA